MSKKPALLVNICFTNYRRLTTCSLFFSIYLVKSYLSVCVSPAKDNPKRKSLAKELEEEEYLLRQCIEKLKSVQGSRSSLVNQLKDALREQVQIAFSHLASSLFW